MDRKSTPRQPEGLQSRSKIPLARIGQQESRRAVESTPPQVSDPFALRRHLKLRRAEKGVVFFGWGVYPRGSLDEPKCCPIKQLDAEGPCRLASILKKICGYPQFDRAGRGRKNPSGALPQRKATGCRL